MSAPPGRAIACAVVLLGAVIAVGMVALLGWLVLSVHAAPAAPALRLAWTPAGGAVASWQQADTGLLLRCRWECTLVTVRKGAGAQEVVDRGGLPGDLYQLRLYVDDGASFAKQVEARLWVGWLPRVQGPARWELRLPLVRG